ncbi:MAG: NAD-dependent epimerase/dehydratase family protein [Limisphaerales bacterium]
MDTVLLTGAAGIVGTLLRPLLAGRYPKLLLTDIAEVIDLAPNESFDQGDITEPEFVRSLTARVDGIIHLAGKVGPDFSYDEVLGPNIIGTHNIFQAAKDAGIKQIINASSHHAVGCYQRGEHIDHQTPPRPDSNYGLSKAFSEASASCFADKFAMNILSIRIGFVGEQVIDERRLHTWCSPRDLAQLIHLGLSNFDLGHQIVYGVSENPDPFFDNSNATRLGYVPQDRAVDHLADPDIPKHEASDQYIGGHFASGPN